MTARDDAIEAGAQASALWHRGEVITDSDDYALVIEVVRAAEPIFRADERAKWLKWAAKNACCEAGFVASPDPCPWHPDGIRERLRAQVEALPHDTCCSETRQEAPCDCLRGEFVALLGGESDE